MSMENPDEVMDLESQQTPPREVDDSYITGSHAASPEHGDVELPRTTDLSPVSPQVSKEVHVSVEDGGGGGGGDEAKQQHADLESGLVVDVDASSGPGVAPSFFKLLKKSCKSCNIFLLFISAVLSIGFGIKEEGTGTGWVEGAILMDAAIILVVLYAMREFWSGNTQHQAVSKTKAELLMAKIDKVCTCMQRIALVSYIAILTISFLHYMLERKDSNSGLPEIKGKATFSVALAIRYRRKKILPAEKANISQEMSALCTMRPAAICISTNVLTLNSRKVKMCYTGDEVIKEEPHALQALSNAIRTSVSTGSTSTENQLLPWTESSLGMEDENLGLNHTDEEDRENGDMWWYFKGPCRSATTSLIKSPASDATSSLARWKVCHSLME